MESFYTTALSIVAALGLAAACGFRVFVPLLVVSLGARAGMLELHGPFAWLASDAALWCLAGATLLEIAAYYVPVVDNLLDTVATPAAVVAGAVVAAAVMTDVDPWLRWTLATIAGGSAAAAVQIPTVVTRGLSTGASGGLANPAFSTGEAVAAAGVAGTAVMWPILLPVAALGMVVGGWQLLRIRDRRRKQASEATRGASAPQRAPRTLDVPSLPAGR